MNEEKQIEALAILDGFIQTSNPDYWEKKRADGSTYQTHRNKFWEYLNSRDMLWPLIKGMTPEQQCDFRAMLADCAGYGSAFWALAGAEVSILAKFVLKATGKWESENHE